MIVRSSYSWQNVINIAVFVFAVCTVLNVIVFYRYHITDKRLKDPDCRIGKQTTIGIFCSIQKLFYKTKFEEKQRFFTVFLPSFCTNIQPRCKEDFHFHFYISTSTTDQNLLIQNEFDRTIAKLSCYDMDITLHTYNTETNNEEMAILETMVEAYLDNVTYYFKSATCERAIPKMADNLPTVFVNSLKQKSQTEIGAVGSYSDLNPQNNTNSDTWNPVVFVHQIHFVIFGYFAPKIFTDGLQTHRWIQEVYSQHQDNLYQVIPTLPKIDSTSTSFRPFSASTFDEIVKSDAAILNRYMNYSKYSHLANYTRRSDWVITSCLYGSNPRYTINIIRVAQLLPLYFPRWTFQVYIEDGNKYPPVPPKVIQKLVELNTNIVKINSTEVQSLPILWRFLVVDQPNVTVFLSRDADSRPTSREYRAVIDWLNTNTTMHCLRDHPSHSDLSQPVLAGLWGARTNELRKYFTLNITSLLSSPELQDRNSDQHFITEYLWEHVVNNSDIICHDRVSCGGTFPHTKPMLGRLHDGNFIGRIYDPYGSDRVELLTDTRKLRFPFQCIIDD